MTDLTVIGGGPGGYSAAIRAAQLGAEVVLVEKDKIGGTCLNRGCIPTKSLWHPIELDHKLKKAQKIGLETKGKSFNYKKMQQWKNKCVKRLTNGVKHLLDKNGVEVIKGTAEVKNKNEINILETNNSFHTENVILAMGSTPKKLPISGINNKNVKSRLTCIEDGRQTGQLCTLSYPLLSTCCRPIKQKNSKLE